MTTIHRAARGSCTWMCVAGLVCAIALAGCTEPAKRLNAPPQGHTACPHEMQQHYVPMVDNELLADMSMSPSDFVPHQPELNGKGVRRLSRYASILRTYGGTLNYDGNTDPDALAEERLDRISDFLVAAGVERDQFTVARGMAGGAGMAAVEAGQIRTATSGVQRLKESPMSDMPENSAPGGSQAPSAPRTK